MKLYTEEQVKKLLDKMSLVTERKNLGVSANFRHRIIEIDNLIKSETPIELPSDEEILDGIWHNINETSVWFPNKSPQEMAKQIIYKLSHPIYRENGINSLLILIDKKISISDKNKIVYKGYFGDNITDYTEDYYWNKVKIEIELIQGGNK